MSEISGIKFEKNGDCFLFHLEDFSEEVKSLIRNHLISICHGQYRASQEKHFYTYQLTLKQLNERIGLKTDEQKMGLIGELLSHVLIRNYAKEFVSVSPYFNLEDNNVKKGFDVIWANSDTREVWLTEVKSGEKNSSQSSSDKNKELINRAKNDLKNHLNTKELNRWQNALNGLVITHRDSDETTFVKQLLEENLVISNTGSPSSGSHNVVLVGSLFSQLTDRIQIGNVSDLLAGILEENHFQKVILVSIHKATYQKILDFLQAEAANDRLNSA